MENLFISSVPYLVLFSHIVLALLFVAILARKSWGRKIYEFLGKHVLGLGLIVSLGAIIGSLFYSEIIGFEACVLCWWQRIFLYPIAPLFALGLLRGERSILKYGSLLALLALIVGGYQEISNLTGASFLACTEAEGACSKVFVKEFGYITIPVMSITVALYIILLAWVNKLFEKSNG